MPWGMGGGGGGAVGGGGRKSSHRPGFMSMQVEFSEREGRGRHSMAGESGGL